MSDTLSAASVSVGVKPDSAGFGTSLKDQITGHTQGIGEHMGSIIKDGLSTMAGPIAAVTAAFGVEHLVEGSVHSFDDLATSVRSMQRVVGGSVEDVSSLMGAMQLSGVSTDNITASMARFEKTMVTAASSGDKLKVMNQTLGMSIEDANGHVKSMSELLPGIADKFASMPDGAEKTALAMQLFGKSGTQLIPVLNKGSDGIAELEGKAKSMGLTLSGDSMKAFADNAKTQREFQATLQGLSVTMGEALMPVMEAVEGTLKDVLMPIIQKLTQFIQSNQGSFEDLGKSIKNIVLPILDLIVASIGNLTKFILDNKTMIEGLIIVVGSAVLAFQAYQLITDGISLAQKAYATIQALVKGATLESTAAQLGLNTALLANPIGIVIAAVAALVAGLVWFFTQTKVGQDTWKAFTSFLTTSFEAAKDGIGTALHWLSDLFSSIWNGITGIVRDAINGQITIVNGLIGAIDGALGAVKTLTGGLVNINIPKIPKLAQGGIVPATPGGRLVTVAEAGQAEAIIPLNKLNSMAGGGSGTTINYYAAKNDSITAEQKLVDAVQRAKVLGAIN